MISTLEDAQSVSSSISDTDMVDELDIKSAGEDNKIIAREVDFALAPKVVVRKNRCPDWFILQYDNQYKHVSGPLWQKLLAQWYALEKSYSFYTSVSNVCICSQCESDRMLLS